jgi:2-dehydro-3-deoxyphosphooctonate aldolase (KDO 8-P synthase)
MNERKPFHVIAGPCVIESEEHALFMAKELKKLSVKYGIDLIFKSSFDKANRTSIESYRGPGLEEGLRILQKVKDVTGLPVISDVHETIQVKKAAEVLDVIQVPALLSRQTDLLVACGKTGRTINIKKGQFIAPENMRSAVEKVRSTGNDHVYVTERGTSFGYNNLVVDFRSLLIMKQFAPVIFDCTHSVQLPSASGNCSSGEHEYAFPLLRAALGVGVSGVFMEVHHDPKSALCDGPNMLNLEETDEVFRYITSFLKWKDDHGFDY